VWFAGLWLLLPWPMPIVGNAFVPAVRYAILATAATAVALKEGAAGPVGGIVGLFIGMTLAATLGCWLLAWVVARALGSLPPLLQQRITWLFLVAGVMIALTLSPYRTYFGPAQTGGLLAVLW
jgi:hypothetical protein